MEGDPAAREAAPDRAFFGREEELRRLVANLRERRHTLVVGDSGIGKSRLMREARLLLTGGIHRVDVRAPAPPLPRDCVLTVSSPAPLGDCLREMAEILYRNGDLWMETGSGRDDWSSLRGRFSRLGIARMQSAILRAIAGSGKGYVVFAGGLERLTQTGLPFFHSLLRIAVVCGSATVTKDTEAFRAFWASFERLPLGPLPGPVAARLVAHLMKTSPPDVADPLLCTKEILASADGNPFYIRNLHLRAVTWKHGGAGDARAFRAADEGPFFNMGPLYMIGAGVLAAVKFFSVGVEKREHYIYYSAVGFVLYLTFRAFRGFFIFRPRRKT